jgi:arylsulfatase A-like enzyme
MRGVALSILLLIANSAIAQRPNILLILAADLGFLDLGCYGSETATPNLDGLAAGGLRFTQFYNTARCWPTRAALLTGFYAQHVRRDAAPGVKRGKRQERSPLLATHLAAAGYRAYHSGKWHLDGKPLGNGFHHSYELRDQHRFFNPTKHFLDDKPLPPVKREDGFYGTIAVVDHALDCLKDHAANFAKQPFFHYLAFAAPNFPLHALPEDSARYRRRFRNGWDEHRIARWQRLKSLGIVDAALSLPERELGPPYIFPDDIAEPGAGEVIRPVPWAELTTEQQEFQATKMAIHAAMIDRMDCEIGRVLEPIRAMNAFEDTLIIFLSDNGASAEIMVRGDRHDPEAPMGSAGSHLCLGPGWSTAANTPFRKHKTWVRDAVYRPLGEGDLGSWRTPQPARTRHQCRPNDS